MRSPRLLGVALLALSGCQSREPQPSETSQATSDPFGEAWERMRHTPLASEVAINDEYEIRAVFPKGSPVCRSDAGTHEHGFFQWLESDCTKEGPGVRFSRKISIWADYNAAEYSRDEAVDSFCPGRAGRGALGIAVPEGRGWVVSCRRAEGDALGQFIVAFLPTDREMGLGSGPDSISMLYSMRLYTDAAHSDADLRTFKTFLRGLKLARTSLTFES